jgi:hypothetical protein
LALTDPSGLVKLKQTGECFFSLPESLFDQDHPGHYFRRLKSVSLTIPAVAGPYQGVHATLTLMKSSLRHDATSPVGGYARDTTADDPRFRDTVCALQSLSTSHANNDTGMFELNFRDDRFLPFEGRGAVSDWKLTLDPEANRWDLDTLADVLVHVNYTAREGGTNLKTEAKKTLPDSGARLFSMRQEFSTAWHRFLHPTENADLQNLVFDLRGKFPYHRSETDPDIARVDLFLKIKGMPNSPADVPIHLYENTTGSGTDHFAGIPLVSDTALGHIHHAPKAFAPAKNAGEWMFRVLGGEIPSFLAETVTVEGIPHKHLNKEMVEDAYLLVSFER